MQKKETSTQRKRRLEKAKLKRQEKLANESDDAKRQRLSKRRDQVNSETPTQRRLQLDKAKQRMQRLREAESQEEHDSRIAKVRQHMSELRGAESNEQREISLRIPPSVMSCIYKNNLQLIEQLAKKYNIFIPPWKKIEFMITKKESEATENAKATAESNTKDKEITTGKKEIVDETNVEMKTEIIDEFNLEIKTEITDDTKKEIKTEIIDESDVEIKTEIIDESDVEIKTEKIDESNANDHIIPKDKQLLSIKERLKNKTKELSSASTSNVFSSTNREISEDELYNTPGSSGICFSPEKDLEMLEGSLWLQGAGDYKYGYEDIITGSFDEKLEECLSKGIEISLRNSSINDLNISLYEDYVDMTSRAKYKQLMNFREKLPAFKKSKEILDTINHNQVVVISGETGCGKSTQVPQIVLDDAILNNKGANVKILVTQPRRIAASSLAMRVAEERGEKMGHSVGYSIRLEKVECRSRGSIVFCTTGILLVDLEVNQGLTSFSHVILDEVHERDTHIDLSMCMLKKVLQKRKDLKLILMSATIDSDKMSSYFDNCPMLDIEGLAYPVQDIYLEDILMMTRYVLPAPLDKKAPGGSWMKYTKRFKEKQADEMQKEIQYKADVGPWLESIKTKLDREVYMTLQDRRIEDLNIELIFEVILHICKDKPGAILVFVPGIGEITKLLQMITKSGRFPSYQYEIYPLHSKLPSLEQHRIFQRPPDHIRKIIVATNIAETSITIDDVVYVIDCGKMKFKGLNIEDNISTLKTEWITMANLKQRRGRAGRCQPGICYHLITSFRAQKLDERLLPELQRSDLLEPVLAIKRLRLGKALDAMKLMAAVPAESTIECAVKRLQQCGALDANETLTPLGWHLARLPVHPCAGKLLLLGALFGCLNRAASVAAVWGFKDPFQLVIGKNNEVDRIKRNFALGELSDHVAISEAIIQWEACPHQHKRAFAHENFLSMNTLQLLSDMKSQFANNLKQMGFLYIDDIRSEWENRNENNLSVFKAIVAASLYPNIASVKWRQKGRRATFNAATPEDGVVAVHPSSVTKPIRFLPFTNTGANWLVYWMKQRSSDLFLIDVTLVYTLPLLFFGELKVNAGETPDECLISVKSIMVRCNRESTELLFHMRALLDQVLASKISKSANCEALHSEFEEQVLNAVIRLITAEDEGVEYVEDDEDWLYG